MRRPCPSDWRTLRVDEFRRRRSLVRRVSQGYAPGAYEGRSFAAFLCEISRLPNLAPAFVSKRNQLDGEAQARRLRNDYANRQT